MTREAMKCTSCQCTKPAESFCAIRRNKKVMRKTCASCRHRHRTRIYEKGSACRELYRLWKENHRCEVCGTSMAIEADHCRGEKVFNCGTWSYWC